MTILSIRLAAASLLVAAALPAQAAPFCMDVTGIPLQCIYVDPASCQRESARQGGNCTANPTEVHTPPGLGQFCVVTGGGAAQCVYADRASCFNDAQRLGGACVEANGTVAGTPDPFRVQRPY
jgi:hypothetical protein